ncbi:MAG: helix-turn-helix domain-containing protein, partial [Pseudomonadota bacterium]|nr:helix-turn-helix domain-containing protein [Pseudomonadota bacterium]
MSTAPAQPFHLLYDPQETFDAFQRRQRSAYQAGKQAWRVGLVNGQALQLYDELVRYVGANKFCWVKEETLAAQLGRSASTIKRWMSQLVEAGLIRRGRRFGHTSLTRITAYLYDASAEPQEPPAAISAPPLEASHEDAQHPADTCEEQLQEARPTRMLDHPEHTQERQPTTTVAYDEPTHEPSISSLLLPHTYNDHHIKTSGGGKHTPPQISESTEGTATTIRLQDEGVNDPDVLHELQKHPLAEVEQVVRYVARCRTTEDPRRPGLIVHLIRRGFGSRHRRRQHSAHDPYTASQRVVPGPEAHS